MKKPRFYASLGIVTVLLLAFLFLPLPYHVYCPLSVEPRNAEPVYVDVAGQLDALHVQPGDSVQVGAPLADLKSSELESTINDLNARRNQLLAQLKSMYSVRHEDPRAADPIDEIKKSLAANEDELNNRQTEAQRLHLVAKRAGVVIPPPALPAHPSNDGRLPTWHGTPLEKYNLGATLKPTTLFCKIGDPGKFDAVLVVDQSDSDQVFKGQNVKIMLAELPGQIFRTQIEEISSDPMKVVPKALSNKGGGTIEIKPDESGLLRPANISYEARAPFEGNEDELLTGLKGQAKINGPWHSLGWRVWRLIQRTFHFKL